MSKHLQIVEEKPNTPRTDANWRNGALRYDHSNDEALAAAGDEKAAARLRTRYRLERRHGNNLADS